MVYLNYQAQFRVINNIFNMDNRVKTDTFIYGKKVRKEL